VFHTTTPFSVVCSILSDHYFFVKAQAAFRGASQQPFPAILFRFLYQKADWGHKESDQSKIRFRSRRLALSGGTCRYDLPPFKPRYPKGLNPKQSVTAQVMQPDGTLRKKERTGARIDSQAHFLTHSTQMKATDPSGRAEESFFPHLRRRIRQTFGRKSRREQNSGG
jgi:hypothetical protein